MLEQQDTHGWPYSGHRALTAEEVEELNRFSEQLDDRIRLAGVLWRMWWKAVKEIFRFWFSEVGR